VLADVMEEEECEDGKNRPASGRKRSRQQSMRRSSRGRTMLLRYCRDVAAARTSNRYGVIGHRVLPCHGATHPSATANGPRR